MNAVENYIADYDGEDEKHHCCEQSCAVALFALRIAHLSYSPHTRRNAILSLCSKRAISGQNPPAHPVQILSSGL